jgi:hypoxanthine phosphoribosyltransferase
MSEREIMTWDELGDGSRDLAQMVADDGYRPDLILAIARGGLLVCGALGYALGVKNTFTMNVEFYTGIDERLDLPMILPPVPDLVDFADFKVLIADDVADTGATLQLVKEFCEGKVAEVRCAVLYEKPRSTVKCEYVWRRKPALRKARRDDDEHDDRQHVGQRLVQLGRAKHAGR